MIEPDSGWLDVGARDVWAHRELLLFLTWRDLKVRYKQTALGAAWALLQPLFTVAIFTFVFSKLAGLQSDGIPYPVFVLAGILPWTYFSGAVTNASNSLVGSAYLITKVYFPRLIVPAAAALGGLVDLAVGSLLLLILMVAYSVPVATTVVLIPFIIGILVLLALSFGLLFSAVNVRYRDVRHLLPFLVQAWMFLTPVVYSLSAVPAKWRWLMFLNPVTGLVTNVRAAMFGLPLEWRGLAVSVGCTLVFFFASVLVFGRMEKSFADYV
jgi:lipopolysaccharide transport system permease protein